MKLLSILAGALPLTTTVNAAPQTADPEAVAAKKILNFQKQYQEHILETIKPRKTGCTKDKLLKRREWHSLTKAERLAYVNAVKCLTTKPSRTPATDIPGARTRYDDFVASHLVETPYVHASGKFLAFHRYYVHIYERALREECGYKGAHPYWDWSLTYKDLAQSPLFDGSDTSMGGDGKYVPDREPTVLNVAPGISFIIPPANGGGCVQKGPFAEGKFEVNLGPVGMPPAGPDNGLGYNPRCLTRDLNKEFSNIARPTNVTKLFEGTPDVGTFLSVMDPPTFPGVHGAGHFSLGGIELDLWASPSDPVFFLHHANIDRMWTIWQGQDLANRTNMMWGTGTTGNIPPSADVTLNTTVTFGPAFGPKVMKDLVSSVDGDMCYLYV